MDREERQRKVEEMCKEKQDMEMAQCTFRPELFSRGTRKVTTSELYLASLPLMYVISCATRRNQE
jgi:hypothetical protein